MTSAKNYRLRLWLIFSLLFCANEGFAQGAVLEIEGATIRGNQELPTVLYVVPWQPAKVQSLSKPEQTLASSTPFELLERGRLLRTLKYHDAFIKDQMVKSQTLEALTENQ